MPFPVELKYIAEAEEKLGVLLPAPYRRKLQRLNGGEVEVMDDWWTLFPVFDRSDRKRMSRTANHIVHETQEAKSWPGFPENGVAIGDCGTGDKLVLLPVPGNPGELQEDVYWFDHETGECQPAGISVGDFE